MRATLEQKEKIKSQRMDGFDRMKHHIDELTIERNTLKKVLERIAQEAPSIVARKWAKDALDNI